jgi:hypothetical protein
MSQDRAMQNDPMWSEPLSESESHTEHQAALDATLFRPAGSASSSFSSSRRQTPNPTTGKLLNFTLPLGEN